MKECGVLKEEEKKKKKVGSHQYPLIDLLPLSLAVWSLVFEFLSLFFQWHLSVCKLYF